MKEKWVVVGRIIEVVALCLLVRWTLSGIGANHVPAAPADVLLGTWKVRLISKDIPNYYKDVKIVLRKTVDGGYLMDKDQKTVVDGTIQESSSVTGVLLVANGPVLSTDQGMFSEKYFRDDTKPDLLQFVGVGQAYECQKVEEK